MRFRMCVRDVLLSCVLASGFIMQAQAEDQPTSEAAAAVTPTSASSPPATSATETTTAITPADDEAERERQESVEFERVAKQYQKQEKDGVTFYCRKEKTLGTRLAKMVCLTDAQLRSRIHGAEDARGITKPGVGCQPPSC